MINPQELVISTEYFDTLKNDDVNLDVQVTIPSSVSVTGSGMYIASTIVELGSARSFAEARVNTSRADSVDYIVTGPYSARDSTSALGFSRTGSLGAYQIYTAVYHSSETEVTATAFIVNPYGSTLTGQSGVEVFTFKIRTYLAPFTT